MACSVAIGLARRSHVQRLPEYRVQLSELGHRICILGPSNSGKSRLALSIARKLDLPAIHLDRLHHQPHTQWQPRPAAEFLALHDEAIADEGWVMDGNYSACLPQRLARATGVILLDVSTPTSLLRYVRRTLFERNRAGALEGASERITWDMLHHIVFVTPANRRRYATVYAGIQLPKIRLHSLQAIRDSHQAWELN
jgi:adenylate kinase family enzyme